MHDAATVSIDEHITCSPTNSASLNLQDHISAGKTCHFKLPCEENTTPALRVRASNSYVHVASLEPKGGGTAFAQPGHLCQVQAGPMRCRVKLWLFPFPIAQLDFVSDLKQSGSSARRGLTVPPCSGPPLLIHHLLQHHRPHLIHAREAPRRNRGESSSALSRRHSTHAELRSHESVGSPSDRFLKHPR